MSAHPRPLELATGYEALRAQATGETSGVTPRGLALFLAGGLAEWMRVCSTLTNRPTTAAAATAAPPATRSDLQPEVVRVLTEMALACQRRWAS